jgi:hypothetical protein
MKLHPEDAEQIKVIEYARYKANQDARWNQLIHVPNEARRSWVQGKLQRLKGVRAGVSDLLLLCPNSVYHGMALELKIKPNKVTALQQKFLDDMQFHGYCTAVAWSGDQAISILEAYLTFK